jgi:hypothetical protein
LARRGEELGIRNRPAVFTLAIIICRREGVKLATPKKYSGSENYPYEHGVNLDVFSMHSTFTKAFPAVPFSGESRCDANR